MTGLGTRLGATLAAYAADEHCELVRASVELLHAERGLGHVCIALADHAGAPPLPDVASWRTALLASGVTATADADGAQAPLVIDDANRLYLRRDHDAERRILTAVHARLRAEPAVAAECVRAALEQLGQLGRAAPSTGTEPDWQLAAVAAGAAQRLLLLTGGPGTGKTTTVARLLSLLLALDPGQRIALCAPTGKAAARIGEAIAEHAITDPRLGAALQRLQPQTLHRLLGYLPLDDHFRFGAGAQLPYDVVVVDEASMLDPAVLAVLLEALSPQARLILVGDRDQLAAVAAGQVLGDLCRAAAPDRGAGTDLAAYVAAATGMTLPDQSDAPAISNAVIGLRVNHRFGAQPGLDHFARAIAGRDPTAALAVLDAGHPDLALTSDPDAALAELAHEFQAAARAETEQALVHLGRLRILAATRHGNLGTRAWNRRVEALLQRQGIRTEAPWYPGRPILVTANDHQNRIYNGDLGVVCRDPRGVPHVAFPAADGGVRMVNTFRVPAHETAWAMTVHKAQGSEFDTVVLGMPDTDSPLWQAPLLYTGITRARRRAIVVADRDRLVAGLGHWPERSSGLAAGLMGT